MPWLPVRDDVAFGVRGGGGGAGELGDGAAAHVVDVAVAHRGEAPVRRDGVVRGVGDLEAFDDPVVVAGERVRPHAVAVDEAVEARGAAEHQRRLEVAHLVRDGLVVLAAQHEADVAVAHRGADGAGRGRRVLATRRRGGRADGVHDAEAVVARARDVHWRAPRGLAAAPDGGGEEQDSQGSSQRSGNAHGHPRVKRNHWITRRSARGGKRQRRCTRGSPLREGDVLRAINHRSTKVSASPFARSPRTVHSDT